MNSLNFFLKFLHPQLVKLASHTDYIQIFDDNGDLVIVFGRYERNPHDLARDCVKVLYDMMKDQGVLQTDEKGRLVLSVFIRKKDER